NQVPPPVTQTINRIVQTTVEKVVPADNAAAVDTKETIVVKEDDATIAAIAQVSPTVVRITASDPSGDQRFGGLGILITSSSTPNEVYVVGNIFTTDQVSFQGALAGGNTIDLTKIATDPASGLSLFSAEQSQNLADAKAYTGATLADSNGVELGQTVISVGGEVSPLISTGIVSSIGTIQASATSTEATVTNILTDISDPDLISNAILIDLSGDVVGFKTGANVSDGFIPSDDAANLISENLPSGTANQ
ncbi:MAG TPA: S1C family serine protease, partial [Candidatus Paceibacterota bacterium]|nr:S1C family serine protease [Candidatus Paceibacterota bacterium]